MIDLYSWATPNGHKIHIMLEECRLSYAVHPIDIGAGAQFDPEFLAISPNNKMPAIIDTDGPDEVHRNAIAKLELAKHVSLPGESLQLPITRS